MYLESRWVHSTASRGSCLGVGLFMFVVWLVASRGFCDNVVAYESKNIYRVTWASQSTSIAIKGMSHRAELETRHQVVPLLTKLTHA